MSKRAVLWIVVGLIVLLLGSAVAVVVLAGGAAFLLARDGAPGLGDEREQPSSPPQVIALGPGRALFLEGTGIGGPMRVRRVDASEGAPGVTSRWEWSAPAGFGSHGWSWATSGESGRIVGQLHPASGTGEKRLVIFDDDYGHRGEIAPVVDGGWHLAGDGMLVALTGDAVVLCSLASSEPVWRVPHRAVNVVPSLLLTEDLVLVAQDGLRILRRRDGSVVREVPSRVGVGIDVARRELLWLRDGRIVVEAMESGAERTVLDVANGAALVDAMEEPTLLGTYNGKWILIYSTELDHIFQGAPTWTRAAPRTLVAVDPESGAVAWRIEIGRWEYDRGGPGQLRTLASGAELRSPLLLHFDGDAEGGQRLVGHLAYVELQGGVIEWQTDYDEPTRSNALFHRVGDASYLLVRDVDDGPRTALARFEDGKLTGAVSLPDHGAIRGPAMTSAEVWLPTETGHVRVHGPQMQVAGVPRPPADARAWVSERLRLPAEAR